MIEFKCAGCGRRFRLKDSFAGKKATCNKCGSSIEVPEPLAMEIKPEIPKLPVRTRRLLADAEHIREVFSKSEAIRLKSVAGDPPEHYQFEYDLRSIEKVIGDKPQFRESHTVEIRLTSDYPRLSPQCRMLTPIFHPNIDAASICVGDHWTAGERLADLVIRIGEMIAYQAYNIKSPLNGEAAMWADLHPQELPIDARNLWPAETEIV
jgi:ubiquitin-protein ligase/DNA-directed RNA polymerase subunit RPC12/RpoP